MTLTLTTVTTTSCFNSFLRRFKNSFYEFEKDKNTETRFCSKVSQTITGLCKDHLIREDSRDFDRTVAVGLVSCRPSRLNYIKLG